MRKPVTSLSELAEIAGVSAMTVSRALRNHAEVSKATRIRIQQLALEHGYCPDPELGKLMVHLRKKRVNRMQGIICALESPVADEHKPLYVVKLLAGARERALRLGFGWEVFSADEMMKKPKRMERILRGRGVEGVLLAPSHVNQNLPAGVNWDLFSVVAATYSVLAPNLRRIVPHHYKNMLKVCQKLTDAGYQRLGLALPFDMDQRVDNHYSTAFTGFHQIENKPMVPLFLPRDRYSRNAVRAWFNQEKPDAIIVASEPSAARLVQDLELSIPGPVAVASANRIEGTWAGVDELPQLIGSMAADMLAGMVLHGEKGLPETPSALMVEGIWHGDAHWPK